MLTQRLTMLFLLVICLLILEAESVDYSQPVSPDIYSEELGFGFSTNWLKTYPPLRKYNKKNTIDVYNAGFRNLRLRCRTGFYAAPYDAENFTIFLSSLTEIVDDCITNGVLPVISWENHFAEAFATDEDQENYVSWWKKVAGALKDKDYSLSFNLFTEIGIDVCQHYDDCSESLKLHPYKYNNWTSRVVKEIRASGGNNDKRILMLGSPKKLAKGLSLIDKTIYENDPYMMAEFHIYASGPNKIPGSPKYWEGDGTAEQRQVLIDELNTAKTAIPLKSYFGAWMGPDNIDGALNQTEVENFSRYFVSVMKQEGMPTALNVLDRYYTTKNASWITVKQNITGQMLDMAKVLTVIQEEMARV